MTKEWEAAIRIKSRKVCYSICKSPHTRKLELKKKYRNIGTLERRKALTAYWSKVQKV